MILPLSVNCKSGTRKGAAWWNRYILPKPRGRGPLGKASHCGQRTGARAKETPQCSRKRNAAMLARTTETALLNYLFPTPKTAPERVPLGGGKRHILPKPRGRGPLGKASHCGQRTGARAKETPQCSRKRNAAMLARTTETALLNYLFPTPKTAPVRVPLGGGKR